jgi:tetratricopeptide (TPR) repeat protein
MRKISYIVLLFFCIKINSQSTTIDKESNNLTLDGNIEFSEKNLIEAEALYRKSISKDSTNIAASYNLANSFYNKELNQEALNQYRSSIKKAKDKTTLHKSFHNLGNLFMKNKDYQNAVNSFKNALLNNPKDDETRYNYVLAKELLKNQQKNNKKDDKDKKNDKDKEENKNNNKKKDNKDNKNEKNKPKPNKISPEQLKNLLKAMDNEEKKVQKKVNKNKVKGVPVKNKKDW